MSVLYKIPIKKIILSKLCLVFNNLFIYVCISDKLFEQTFDMQVDLVLTIHNILVVSKDLFIALAMLTFLNHMNIFM